MKSILLSLACLSSILSIAQSPNDVTLIGEMRNVMWKGQLSGSINLDTIADKSNLYGLGPLEYLSGEIVIIDGKSYQSTVSSDSTMIVEETFDIKAPFFGYANIKEWSEESLPDSIQTIQQLESYLNQITKSRPRPFMFKLLGSIDHAKIHIVNLPKGAKVSSPDEAHRGQVSYRLKNQECEIIGFFSTEHQAVFTHHDTFVHMHYMSADRSKMGHIDDILFTSGTMKLFLPLEN